MTDDRIPVRCNEPTAFAVAAIPEPATRRPRFRRASEPPSFALTEDDGEIVRHLARDRFRRSAPIATLVNRSLDRADDRLLRLTPLALPTVYHARNRSNAVRRKPAT